MIRFALVLVVSLALALPASASCLWYSTSSGPGATVYKATLDAEKNLTLNQVQFSALYSWRLNLLPNSDCSVRWVSLVGDAMVGLGGAAVGNGVALNITPAIGIGFYNSLVELLVGYDALNIAQDSSGLFLGKLSAQNFGVYVALSTNLDFSGLLAKPGTVPMFNYVKP